MVWWDEFLRHLSSVQDPAFLADYGSQDLRSRPVSWPHNLCSYTGTLYMLRRAVLGLMLCFCHLEILNTFGTRSPASSFVIGP